MITFRIPVAIYKAKTFIFDTNVAISVTFDTNPNLLLDSWICN